jgi:hypothetical protein
MWPWLESPLKELAFSKQELRKVIKEYPAKEVFTF